MRIIGGKYKSYNFNPPRNIDARPTTDRAKESLINILISSDGIEEKNCLDIFCGTGNISFEFASQGANFITSVDVNANAVLFVKNTFKSLGFENFEAIKKNAFKWIAEKHNKQYDIIFADPPYDLADIDKLPGMIFNSDLIFENTILIIEHRSNFQFVNNYLYDTRKYGQSAFSFFRKN
ncbi:MAG: RsmD family RNA methyltransferase [Bacteroidetes bacterium]|nr:RsmD family RNA methyltransferase [Bacteroidota bacterium]